MTFELEHWLIKKSGNYVNIGFNAMLLALPGLSRVFNVTSHADAHKAVYPIMFGAKIYRLITSVKLLPGRRQAVFPCTVKSQTPLAPNHQ